MYGPKRVHQSKVTNIFETCQLQKSVYDVYSLNTKSLQSTEDHRVGSLTSLLRVFVPHNVYTPVHYPRRLVQRQNYLGGEDDGKQGGGTHLKVSTSDLIGSRLVKPSLHKGMMVGWGRDHNRKLPTVYHSIFIGLHWKTFSSKI